jgi:MoxR-like ATPase
MSNTLSGHQPAADILDGPDPSRSGIESNFQQSEHITHTLAPPITTLQEAYGVVQRLRDRLRLAVRGRDNEIELIIIALLADGHVLLEDYPGSGKTTLAKALGHSILDDLPDDEIPDFRRLQFTPDLLPSDVTGVMIFDTGTNTFQFRRGPVFAYVVLVDEINRTSPKVQAALLEAMAEKQVTVDNVCYRLNELFFVIATQNPLDAVGTYPLPMAQLDRFLFKLTMSHIDRESELEVLRSWGQPRVERELPRVTRGDVVAARRFLRDAVAVAPAVHECLVDIAQRLRDDKRTRQGVSTRCLVQAIPALQTIAMLRGRDFVSSEDVEYLARPLFSHRLELAPGVADSVRVIADAVRQPIEALSRGTLR